NPAVSTYRMELSSPHLPAPTDGGSIELGSDAHAFAAQVIRDIDKTIANRVSDETVRSFGLILRDKMPEVLFTLLEHVWKTVNGPDVPAEDRRVPDVLLLTDDWMVPWELLMVDLDPDRPQFLGAQVNLGRWPLEHLDKLAGTPLGLEGLGIMIGYYKDARGVAPLQRAEEEGAVLVETYEARAVNADHEAFDQLLAGQLDDGFAFQALHFAGHGQSDPDKGTYLMYSDGAQMSVMPFRSARIAADNDAFLFVNACQVGTAAEVLGEYAGLAGLAIAGGFRGFVAPLWSVADDLAQSISLGMYEASTQGTPIAAYLRDVRARFRQTEGSVAHTTYIAYTYYGHPRLVLGGPKTREVTP
ncbi:MAG: CHAT domain-containing protein, partial [Nitriliruptorales bacterium]|nr:CHAT domain-containing protein [Nitriliruptorales bacterium]